MCILTPHDDILPATLAQKVIGASDRLAKAQAAVVRLALRLDDGDSAAALAASPDHFIRRTIGEMFSARFELDAALCSLAHGSTYPLRPTEPAICLEMQSRMQKNGGSRARPASSLPAVGSFAAE